MSLRCSLVLPLGAITITITLLTGCSPTGSSVPPFKTEPRPETSAAGAVASQIAALEGELDSRVGISAVDTGSGRSLDYRAYERFGYASTSKAIAAAAILATATPEQRSTRVYWTLQDVEGAGYSPVATEHRDGLTLDQLAEAAVRDSDNTAMNLLLAQLGGPEGLRAFLRGIGDDVTKPVNTEPRLNEVRPGSIADTSTPAAFNADLRALLTGELLAAPERVTMLQWMSGNVTGDALIRSVTPAGWVVADKSGGGGPIRNDVAIVTPPGRDPIVITIFTTRNDPTVDYDEQLVARTAAIVLTAFAD